MSTVLLLIVIVALSLALVLQMQSASIREQRLISLMGQERKTLEGNIKLFQSANARSQQEQTALEEQVQFLQSELARAEDANQLDERKSDSDEAL